MTASPERLLRALRDRVLRPGPDDGDAELLARFVARRDEAAFAALVERHGPMVLGVCRRVVGDVHLAEDVAQATFLVLAREAGRLRRPEALAAWLHRSARNLALKQRRAEVRRQRREARSSATAVVNPLDELTVRELLAIFDDELQRLPEQHRLPLILCCLEGLTQDEAATRLGWSAGSVKGRLERGRAALRAALARRGLGLPAALMALEAARGTASAGFVSATAWTAVRFAEGATDGGLAAAIAEGGLRSTGLFRARVIGSLLLSMGLLTAGVAAVARREKAAPPPASSVEKRPRVDRHGDPLPEGALARLGSTRRANGEVRALAFGRGEMVAAADWGVSLLGPDGKSVRHIDTERTSVSRLAFSPDGRRLIGGVGERSGGLVRVWDASSGRLQGEHKVDAVWVGWSPGGEPLAVSFKKDARKEAVLFHDLGAGSVRRLETNDLPGENVAAAFVSCAPAAGLLALGGRGMNPVLHVWDVRTGKKLHRLDPKVGHVAWVALAPDGRRLAAVVADKKAWTTRLWDLESGKPPQTLGADVEHPSSVAFSPDGEVLTTVGHFDLRLWDASTGRQRARLEAGRLFSDAVAFSPDGKALATSNYECGAVRLWDVATGAPRPTLVGHDKSPSRIDFSPDGSRVVSCHEEGGTAIVWNPSTGEALSEVRGAPLRHGAYFTSDGRTVMVWTGQELLFHNASTGEARPGVRIVDPAHAHVEQCGRELALSADRKTVVAFSNGHDTKNRVYLDKILVTALDLTTREPLFRRYRDGFSFQPIVSPDLRAVALAQNGPFTKPVDWLANGARPVLLEDLRTGEKLLNLPEIKGQTHPITFSPDGRLLATLTSPPPPRRQAKDTLRLWEWESAGEVLALATKYTHFVAFRPDGRLLAAVDQDEIGLWDSRSGKELRRLGGFGGQVTSLKFSPDGRRLVSGLPDGTLLVWDVADLNLEKSAPLDAAGAARAWADLAADAKAAFAARGALAGSPAVAVSMLRERLRPATPGDPAELRRLLADLDADAFAVREQARQRLEVLGDRAAEALQVGLKAKPSPEAARRIEALLKRLRPPVTDAETLRGMRAVAVLEDAGTPEARRLLETIAAGAAGARLTREAKAALGRLARR